MRSSVNDLLPNGCTKFSQFGFRTLITVQWPMEQTSILSVKFADCPVARFRNCAWLWKWLLVLESPSFHVSTWLQETYFGNESPFETTWYMVAWNIPAFPRGYPTRLLGPCFYVSGTYVPTLPHQVARASFPCACIRDVRSLVVKTFSKWCVFLTIALFHIQWEPCKLRTSSVRHIPWGIFHIAFCCGDIFPANRNPLYL